MREKKLVLLVEDTRSIARVTQFRLERGGFGVIIVDSGEEALEVLEKARPDVILLDHGLPGMDGAEVCRALKSDDRYRSIPVILFTATAHKEELKKITGVDDVIIKPYEPSNLIEIVEKHLLKGERRKGGSGGEFPGDEDGARGDAGRLPGQQ